MADMKISQFPAASSADASDVLAGVQSGTTKKFSLAVILAWIKSQLHLTSKDVGAAADSSIAQVESSSTSAHTYAVGDRFMFEGELREATAPINAGDTITPGTNCDTVTVNDSFVPTTRKVNNKALSSDITLAASDVGAMPSTATLDDIPNGTTYAKPTATQVAQIGTNQTAISAIEGKIPSAASPLNQLADKDFVTDSITQGTAIFRGSFATRAALLAVQWQTTNPSGANYVSNNDYAVVLDDETQNDECWRYIYVTGTGWTPQYRINESPLTQAQLDALNSGATTAIISSVGDKLDKTGDGSNVTATFTAASTRANISTGEKLSVMFGKIAKWFADLGTAAFAAISTSTPNMDGTGAAGSTGQVSDAGHTHPSDTSRVPVYGMGKNLLRNWYFVGGGTGRGVFPVNQRGVTSGTSTNNTYSIDAWKWTYSTRAGSWALNPTGLTLTPDSASDTVQMFEYLENTSDLNGKSITASILRSDGTLKYGTITRNSSITQFIVDESDVRLRIFADGNFRIYARTTQTIVAVKLELGTEQTLAHLEGSTWVLNEIPDYEYELYRCITSTADSTDDYANKSLATEQQIAYVETGTTASQNYTAGQYISLNGLIYTADTAIASGATFYTSGGNKNLTECVGGGLNSLKAKLVTNHTITYSSADTAFLTDTPPIDSRDLAIVGRNTNTGAIYAMWYRAASHGFRISATLYGNAPANGDTCIVQYAS